MNLEKRIFRKKYKYKQKFINVCILRIKYGHRNERTVRGYKMYVFKMMHDIVQKNIYNFINLITNGTSVKEIPTHDDVLTDAYITFDKCIEKFRVGGGNTFYYYFNKSLSRNFFREYQRIQKTTGVELTDAIETININLHYQSNNYDLMLIINRLNFNDIESKVALSKVRGERISEFLDKNKNVTAIQYQMALKRIKMIIAEAIQERKW